MLIIQSYRLCGPQLPRPSSFQCLSLLVAPVEGIGIHMAASEVIQVFDLVDSNDPVLGRECLLDYVERWALIWYPDASYTIHGLSRRVDRCEVVVGHLVPGNC